MDEEKIPEISQPSPRGLQVAVIILICLVVISLGYAIAEHGSVSQLTAQNQQANAQLAETETQIQALSQRLQAIQASAAAKAKKVAEIPRRPARVIYHPVARVYRRRMEQSHWQKIQAELAEHQREIDMTQRNLQQTRNELQGNLRSTADQLNGAIAKNHTELVALEKLGLRNYYEFDIGKTKLFQREGPISLKLRKANVKHQFANLQLVVNDRELTENHVNLYQPVLFYPENSRRPVQLVINGIFKNEIRGYVSAPKYKRSELAANAAATSPANENDNLASSSTSPVKPTPVALEHRPSVQN